MAEAPAQVPEGNQEIEHGAYEILKARLLEQARQLKDRTDALNRKRAEIFRSEELRIIGNERIRTEHACIPADIVAVKEHLLFGYNVQMTMKTAAVRDVFSLHRFEPRQDGFDFPPLSQGDPVDFLAQPEFVKVFDDMVRYYKGVRLRMLRYHESRLLAEFQTGETRQDRRTLEWNLNRDGNLSFQHDKASITYPPSHSFEWIETTRDNHIRGLHPHVNIANKVFVECVGGDLTVKIEDNTDDGLGVYREEVEHSKQALHDAAILYHDADELILLRILPYREQTWRHLVYNTRDKRVHRIDAIGKSCIMLPNNHGIVFPGGYYLLEGTLRKFDGEFDDLVLERPPVVSPNGEDVLYVFRNPETGEMVLLAYNLVGREMSAPIRCHGFSTFDDGKLVVFRSEPNAEAATVHPVQIWQTPFVSREIYELAPRSGVYLEKIGNTELVNGVSDCFSICRRIQEQAPSTVTYLDLINQVNRSLDSYHWLDHPEVGQIHEVLTEVRKTAELVLTEFDKVQTLKKQATTAVAEATEQLTALVKKLHPEDWKSLDDYVTALDGLRTQRGHLITLREMRYADQARLDELEKTALERFDAISAATVEYLLTDQAFRPYLEQIDAAAARIDSIEKANEVAPLKEELEHIGKGLELLSEVVGSLKVDDATLRTRILENISEVLSNLNRSRALVEARRKKLGESESVAEFSVGFKLFSQNVSSTLNLADTPEKCDESLSALMLQLEELEAKFGEYDQFVADLIAKREEVYNSFSAKKQVLVDQRQRRVSQLVTSGERIIESIVRRASTLKDTDKLNSYFASDPMVMKVRDLADRLRELSDPVKADELLSRLKVARQDSARGLRDRQDLFEEGAAVVKLGRHKFSLNTEPIELTMVPRDDRMALHITGTDYFEPLKDEAFEATREFWPQELVSETSEVYRAEYLAYCILDDAERQAGELSMKVLTEALLEAGSTDTKAEAHGPLLAIVRKVATERYDEGYDRGVHDVDAAILLESLVRVSQTAGLLRFSPKARSLGLLCWSFGTNKETATQWLHQARSLILLNTTFGPTGAEKKMARELQEAVSDFCSQHGLKVAPEILRQAGNYLLQELGSPSTRFVTSGDAVKVKDAFLRHLEQVGTLRTFKAHLDGLKGQISRQVEVAKTWIAAFVRHLAGSNHESRLRARYVQEEAAVLLLTEGVVEREITSAVTSTTARGLLGQHPRVHDRSLEIRLDEFLTRLEAFRYDKVPAYRAYQKSRHHLIEEHKHRLRLEEYTPKVMSAFVRNKLINEVYLPLIGDNLAKQMGSVGETKRTDLMGMLLLISPPGYGKTTLMEYIASRLGLVFVKVNGPALGHSVSSLDPNEANNATAAQEVEKVNFALEMANNVMLYLDDIQHCDPEFLQKFISLCDGQRRIEGVWKGRTRTYDLKGKRFCIVMAGNPYTESGGRFQIPDMLANRADTYNLGDVLSGKKDLFELSYLENSLTSNPVLAPLTGREPEDLYKLVQVAQGLPVPTSELKHNYTPVELEDIKSVLQKLLVIQKVLLGVNQEYIRSASMDDNFRAEPAFKLQGSYRNMNKMAEKVVPIMNDAELEQLIDDHYLSESQTLTTGAEQNLLKLAELRDRMSDSQRARWTDIKKSFGRRQLAGGDEQDPMVRVTSLLGVLSERLEEISHTIESASQKTMTVPSEVGPSPAVDLAPYLGGLNEAIKALAERPVQLSAAGAPVAVAPAAPPPAAPQPVPASAPSEENQAVQAALNYVLQIVPLLRGVADTIRGPRSKTIVMDPRLVKVFDGLREADTIEDVVEALEHIKKRKKEPAP